MPIADGYRAAMTAANCGYRDTANFCREFKRRSLKTPMEARHLGHHLNLSAVYTA